jgi:PPOX class probable F420-dependent enzyme
MRRLDDDEVRAFLTAGTRTGKLAVVRLDGRPMVVPIWFVVDDDRSLLFTTWRDTIKGKAVRRDGRVSLCVDEEQPPFAYVRVDGTATIEEDPELLRSWATRIAARYMGEERAPEFGERNGVPGELLVRITPTRIVAEADISD